MGSAVTTAAVITGFAIHIVAGFSARGSAPSVSAAPLESPTMLSSAARGASNERRDVESEPIPRRKRDE